MNDYPKNMIMEFWRSMIMNYVRILDSYDNKNIMETLRRIYD
jgi:hypothetical protein